MTLGGAQSCSAVMHRPKEERSAEETLYTFSQTYSSLPRTVANGSNEVGTGWRLAISTPIYLTETAKKGKTRHSKTISKAQLHKTSHGYASVMGGHLNDNSDYIYEGGLSSRITGNSTTSLPQINPVPPSKQPFKITLKPVALNKSEWRTKQDLSHLVHSQMKPDISYDQILIEQNLQTLKLPDCSLPSLEGTGDYKQSVSIEQFPNVWKKEMSVHKNKVRRRRKDFKTFDWSTINQTTTSFRRNDNNGYRRKPENAIQASFSRLLESSSVIFSYKKKH